MRRVFVFIPMLVVACSDSTNSSNSGCKDNESCGAGAICIDGGCRSICRNDKDCGTNSCDGGKVCTDSLCVAGCRNGAPTILDINGDGTEDTGPTDSRGAVTTNHIQTALTITGTDLAGVTVELIDSAAQKTELVVAVVGDTEIAVDVPPTLVEGQYLLAITNAVGTAQATVWVVRGEQGVIGPVGPQGPAPNSSQIQSAVSAMTNLDVPTLAGRPASGYHRTASWGRFLEAESNAAGTAAIGAVITDAIASGGQAREADFGQGAGILWTISLASLGESVAPDSIVVEVRMKVANNAAFASDQPIVQYGCRSTIAGGGNMVSMRLVAPDQFQAGDQYQTFAVNCPMLPDDTAQSVEVEYLRDDQTILTLDTIRIRPSPRGPKQCPAGMGDAGGYCIHTQTPYPRGLSWHQALDACIRDGFHLCSQSEVATGIRAGVLRQYTMAEGDSWYHTASQHEVTPGLGGQNTICDVQGNSDQTGHPSLSVQCQHDKTWALPWRVTACCY